MFTIVLPVMLAAMGLVVDLGWSYYTEQATRAAAESAALAAAYYAYTSSSGSYTCGSNGVVCQSATQCPVTLPNVASNASQVACYYAKYNGFFVSTGGTQNVLVAAGTGTPPTVSGLTVGYWVTVTVSQSLPQTFSAILGNSFSTVSSRATATYLTNSGGCIYVLNPSATGIAMSGTPGVYSGCGVYVNSSSSSAVLLSGTPTISVTGGGKINVVGGIVKSGTPVLTPTPVTGATAVADPYSSLTAPTAGACIDGSGISKSGTGTTALVAGTYCHAITASGTGTFTLGAGTYILEGGMSLSGGWNISGTGVTLYLKTGGISMSGTGAINLTAPTSGAYNGIVIFQDRANTSADALSGGTAQVLTGVLYMPKAGLTYSGGSGTGTSTTIVCDNITFSGNTYIKQPASTGQSGSTGAALIE